MTNEQRAHDLCLIYINLLMKIKQPNENNEIALDPLTEYSKLYPDLLERINELFPNS